MEASTEDEELATLKEVLDLDPGNLDAVMVMMQHQRIKNADQMEILRRLIELGERRIGKEGFASMSGEFWGFLETRPYMRARQQLAALLHDCDRLDEAQNEWEGMLELNPDDNQGVRYELLASYLAAKKIGEAEELMKRYPEDIGHNVVFAWGLVLVDFLQGNLSEAKQALRAARKLNIHAQGYVSGTSRLPRKTPGMYVPGSAEEAQCYAKLLRAMGKPYPKVRSWLIENDATPG